MVSMSHLAVLDFLAKLSVHNWSVAWSMKTAKWRAPARLAGSMGPAQSAEATLKGEDGFSDAENESCFALPSRQESHW